MTDETQVIHIYAKEMIVGRNLKTSYYSEINGQLARADTLEMCARHLNKVFQTEALRLTFDPPGLDPKITVSYVEGARRLTSGEKEVFIYTMRQMKRQIYVL